jgi:Sulfotransferase family
VHRLLDTLIHMRSRSSAQDSSPSVEIDEVSAASSLDGAGHGWLDSPTSGQVFDGVVLTVGGWACTLQSRITEVELLEGGRRVRRCKVDLPSPDIATRFPSLPGAETSRFLMGIGLIGLPSPFEIEVHVIAGDQRWPLAVIRGRRTAPRYEYVPLFRPLMVTSLGRTGTTLLMRMLSVHPEVVVYDTHPYEIRAATHWMHVLRTLSEPGSFVDLVGLQSYLNGLESAVRGNPFSSPHMVDEAVARWAATTHPLDVAAFCRRGVDDFYRQVALSQSVAGARRFAEKLYPSLLADVLAEVDGSTVELISVRDPRDMLCSLSGMSWWRKHSRGGGSELGARLPALAAQLKRVVERRRRRGERAHVVRYEDLAARPHEALESILAFAGLDAAPATIGRMVEHGFADIPEYRAHRTTDSVEASVGRWRRELEPSLQELCADAFGEALVEFGYERE